MLRRSVIAAGAAALAMGGTAACAAHTSDGSAAAGAVPVVAGFYPLQFVTEQVGGDDVAVTNLVPPGAEAHDLELTPRQVAAIADAGVVVYLWGFQPAVDAAVAQQAADAGFDVTGAASLLAATAGDAHGHGEDGDEDHTEEGEHAEGMGTDPHIWLDPTRLATVADALADRLATVDPDNADGYAERAADLRERLEALDEEYVQALATCELSEIVVSHAAFGYLADRYGLEQVAISGLSPEIEPSPARLAQVVEKARAHGATTIFFETLVSPRVAEVIADEVGAGTAVLDPIEGLTPDSTGDYLSVMRANLAALSSALGCA